MLGVAHPDDGLHPRSVTRRLQRIIAQEGDALRATTVSGGGWGAYRQFIHAALVLDAQPDLVMLSFNMRALSPWWTGYIASDEARFIGPAHIPRAFFLPLQRVGITADQLIYLVAVRQSPFYEPWKSMRALQNAMNRAREDLGARLSAAAATEVLLAPSDWLLDFPIGDTKRALVGAFAGATPEHPMLKMLDASVRAFRRAGVSVVVFVMPVNLERYEDAGLLDQDGLARSLASVEEVALGAGATFSKMHDRFDRARFADLVGHLDSRGENSGAQLLALDLRQIILAELAREPVVDEASDR